MGRPVKRLAFLAVVFASCGLLTACAAGTGDGGEPVDRSEYPSGPYGTGEGDVIDDLSFAKTDGGAFTLNDIFADESKKLLLVSTAAGWCAPCREEQPALQERYAAWKDKGLAVLVAIFEDSSYQTPSTDFVTQWRSQYSLTFDVVLDEPFVLSAYYNADLTPMNMFVTVDTMKILRIQTGFDASTVDALIESQLDD
jgi:peroxiredoxin